MNKINRKDVYRGALAVTTTLVLCAFNEQVVAASTTNAAAASSGSGYEIVPETHPENHQAYAGRVKSFYDLCVAAAQSRQLPVKPFVTLPSDYVTTRETYASEGKNYFEKTEYFDLNANAMLPESGCAIQISPSSTTKIWHDGSYQMQQVDNGGAPVIGPPEKQMAGGAPKPKRTKPYSQRQTLQGVAMRCLPNDSPVIQSGALLASCIFDGAGDTTLLNAAGKPIMLHARIPSNEANPRFASILVTTPKSVVTGKSIPASRFTLKAANQ